MFYAVCLWLPVDVRMKLDNMMLVAIAYDHDLSYYGAEQVIAGVVRRDRETYVREPTKTGTSIGASLRRLARGIEFSYPCADGLSIQKIWCKGFLLVLSADYPAAGWALGTSMSTSANCFCRHCNLFTRRHGEDDDADDVGDDEHCYPCACSFLEENPDLPSNGIELHTPARRAAERAEYEAMVGTTHQKELDAMLRGLGINSFFHGFTDVPFVEQAFPAQARLSSSATAA